MRKTILFLDPGKTVGYAIDQGRDWRRHPRPYITGMVAHEALWKVLDDFKHRFGDLEIGVEDYSPREGVAKDALIAVEVIGVIKEWCRQNGVEIEVWQQPAEMFYFTDERLKEAGLWDQGAFPHGMDALRHLLKYLRNYLVETPRKRRS